MTDVVAALATDWSRIYFISWYVLAVVVISNLVIAQILEAFFDESEQKGDNSADEDLSGPSVVGQSRATQRFVAGMDAVNRPPSAYDDRIMNRGPVHKDWISRRWSAELDAISRAPAEEEGIFRRMDGASGISRRASDELLLMHRELSQADTSEHASSPIPAQPPALPLPRVPLAHSPLEQGISSHSPCMPPTSEMPKPPP